jgi:PAS domain S-box-containing protein
LVSAERSDEIFPILLEEIVSLGFERALVSSVDFDSGEVKPVAALNFSKHFQLRFKAALWQGDNPIIGVLNSMHAAVLPKGGTEGRPLYCHPILYRNHNLCWEADRAGRKGCLAVRNFEQPGKLDLEQQVCRSCGMRAYAAVVVVELPKRSNERSIAELRGMIELANRYLSRLFKVDHYYNRMRDADMTIAQLQTLMQSMADPVILTDSQHRVVAQNRAAERFFKLPSEVTEGAARAVELNNLLFSAALSSMAVSGTSDASRDLTLVDVIEGEEVLFEAVTAPSYSKEGIRSGLVTVMRDVTDLRRADQEFRANMERLREAQEIVRQDRDRLNLVIENVGDPIIVADSAARIVLLDPLAQALFGRAATGEEQEKDAADPDVVKNQVALDAYLQNFTFSFSSKLNSTLRLYQPDSQSEVEYDTRSGKIYDKRGQVSYTITVLRDLSALRKLEQLKMERRMLEIEKFAATGRLAGTIAHEINNPMEAIKNSIFLLNNQVSQNAEPVYQILKSETERVARIVRQMLGLYRHSEQVGTIDVNTIVEDTLTLFMRQLERADIRVEKKLGALPPIVGSPDQFRQVLSNLVVNARDSMSAAPGEEGEARPQRSRLVIRTRHLPASDGIHGYARITVADTGSGIPPAMIKSIFEPFVSTKGEKGTGLGLWIVKGIIENHGGKMRVRSKLGAGTVFKFDLPVVR